MRLTQALYQASNVPAMSPIARFSVETQSPPDHNRAPSLFEVTANAALLSGTNREAIAGLIHLIDTGAIPRDIHHPDLTRGEGWAHYLARFGQEAEPGEHTLSLADRFRALTQADIALDDVQHRTPLVLAVQAGNLAAMSALIEAGAQPDFADAAGRTPLHHAVFCGAPAPVLSVLLAHTAAIDQADHGGQTALQLAVFTNNEQAVGLLLTEGAGHGERDQAIASLQQPPPAPGDSLLTHHAAMHGQTSVLKQLAQAGWPLDARDMHGNTALHHAAEGLHLDAMNTLLEAGASVDSRNCRGRTPLLLLTSHLSHTEVSTPAPDGSLIVAAINTLSGAGADINARPPTGARYRRDNISIAGRTPLHWAVAHGHLPSIRALLESGADPETVAHDGRCPRDLAANDPAIYALFDQHTPPAS